MDCPQLLTNKRSTLNRIREVWRKAMMEPLNLEPELIEYMTTHKAEFFRRGGLAKSDKVPAMLTAGEYGVSKQAVAQHGVGLFEAINSLALPKEAVAQRIQGFAAGGWVRPLTNNKASQPTHTAYASLRPDRPAPRLDSAGRESPKLPDLPAPPAPTKTIRVQLAAGPQRVSATLAVQDEVRLLDLLKNAKSRVCISFSILLTSLLDNISLTLPDDLLWIDEHSWTLPAATVSYLLTETFLMESAIR